jgi:CDP-glycerol glycerophosphotransferase (TagB/SpsB family)
VQGVNDSKPVIFISVTTGWAIRNFFQTGVVARLASRARVVVLANQQCADGLRRLGYDRAAEVLTFDPGREPLRWKLARQLKKKIYLESRQSSTEAIWEKYYPRPAYQRLSGVLLKKVIHLPNPMRLYAALDWADMRWNTSSALRELFERYRPSLYFATHATTYVEEFFFRNARAAGVRSVFMILSWDHLSSKVLLHLNYDAILVWNAHTQREIVQTYPQYAAEQIRIVGIPQYDLYAETPRLSRAEWCRRYGLDPARRTILFSTMPQARHEQQHVIIEDLLRAVALGRDVPGDLQVLIKCHPFDNFAGYDALLGKGYPVGIHRSSLPTASEKEEWVPDQAEMEASRDALAYCDININIFSTVTIEAAYFDKPVIHVAYDPQPVQGRIPCHEYYNWDHFKPIVATGASILVRSLAELLSALRAYVENPGLRASERRDLVRSYIGRTPGTAAQAVADELAGLMTVRSSAR